MSDAEYWFFLPDVLPVAVHALPPTPVDGTGPALRLVADGQLRWLDNNAVPPTLVNPFHPGSVARVYAMGHHPPADGRVDNLAGEPSTLAVAPLLDGPDGPLLRHLSGGPMTGRDWLVVTVDGHQVRWEVRALPRARPPAEWIPAHLELAGVPGSYLGEIVHNATHQGWCLPRFTAEVAAEIITDLARTPVPPRGLTRLRLGDPPDGGGHVGAIGADVRGFYRVGAGIWPWVSRTLLPAGRLHRFVGLRHGTDSLIALPAAGQDVFIGDGALMWLVDGSLVTRSVVEDGTPGADWERLPLHGIGCIDVDEEPAAPIYPTLEATTAMGLRAVEHLLRLIAPVAAPPAASVGTAGSRLPNLLTDP